MELVATFVEAGHRAVDPESAASEGAVSRRSVTLRPSGPVALWPVAVARTNGRTVVTVSGSAPLGIGSVTARVTTRAGDLVAAAIADVGASDQAGGSAGGASLGIGSFAARIVLPDPVPAGILSIEVAWRDARSGSWGSSWQSITAQPRVRHAAT